MASSDGKNEPSRPNDLNKTSYAYVEERPVDSRINTSNSVSNTFAINNESYHSQKNGGYHSPALPYENGRSKSLKKNKRKALITNKKKVGSVNMNMDASKSISPVSMKFKKKKDKSMPFVASSPNKIGSLNPENFSANTSFTIENGKGKNGIDGKNLIDEFNQKYAATEKLGSSNRGDSDSSEPEKQPEINENVAIIHVIDETKKRKQDFRCSITKLLKHMKYFEK